MTYFIGVDPGKNGAFSVVDENSRLHDYWRMGQLFDMRIKMLPYLEDLGIVAIEKAGSMPVYGRQQGAKGMFTYGKGYGMLLGMFETLKINYAEIHPRTWMLKMFGTDTEKGQSKENGIKLAKAMHPDHTFIPSRCRTIHDGITDATCIAHYARRYLQ